MLIMSKFVQNKALEIMQIRPYFIAVVLCLVAISCSKEQPESPKQDQTVPASEFEALKKEVEDLKAALAAITSENIEVLKQENEALKAQVESLTSSFFEVDGLRFDKNGEIISTPKLESMSVQKGAYDATLEVKRTTDANGWLKEVNSKYTDKGNAMYHMQLPFITERVLYDYNGKTCIVTTQKTIPDMPVGVPYYESTVETTYW